MGVVGEKPLITRMLLLILPLLTLVAAKPDPAGIFDSVQAQGRISEEVSVARMLKESGVATLEKTLENGNDCMAMAMCRHGATKAMAKEDAFYVAMKTFTAFLKVNEAHRRFDGGFESWFSNGRGSLPNSLPLPRLRQPDPGAQGRGVCVLCPILPGICSELRNVRNLQPGSLWRSLSRRWPHLRLNRLHLQPKDLGLHQAGGVSHSLKQILHCLSVN